MKVFSFPNLLSWIFIPLFLSRALNSTPEEVAQQAEQEKQRSDRLAVKLRELNIDPDTV